MTDLTDTATRLLAQRHGVITSADLRRCDVRRSALRRLLRLGVLRAEHRGVFVLSATPPTIEQRCAVLSAAHPTGFVTGPTAGMLLGLRRMPYSASLHYAVRHGIHLPSQAGVHFRQTTALIAAHRVIRGDGVTIARPRRLAFDLAADLQLLDLLSVLHQLLDRSLVTLDELVATADLLCHPARPGSGRFRQALERLGSGAPAQSHPEVVLAEALRARDVPVECQTGVVRSDSGREIHIDLAVPALKWGVELDIHPEHRSVEGHAGDARRYRGLHGIDWQVEPVSEGDLADVNALADELAELYRARRRRAGVQPSVL